MLQSFNLCRTKLKINNLIIYNNKYASYCLQKTQIQNRRHYSNLSTNRELLSKTQYPGSITTVVRYNTTGSNTQKSSETETPKADNFVELTRAEKLKKAVKEYGTTVIVFHVTISLISLGICYVIVSAGLDVESFFIWVGFKEDVTSKLATKTGTFVAAYAFHKIFAPVRISITLASAPFIVRYLRNIGWLKKPIKHINQSIQK